MLGYNVYRDGKKLNRFLKCGSFYVDLPVKKGARHSYAITAVDLSGREGAKSAELVVVLDKVVFGGQDGAARSR